MKLQDLNTQQLKAVQTVNKPVLVFAGAGSGKTRVLTYKVWHLIKEKLFKPEEILALTFTNKAAAEMKLRIQESISCDGVNVGTFHSIGARMLRMHISTLDEGYNSSFTIYDTSDQKSVIKEVVENLNLSEFKELNVGFLKVQIDKFKNDNLSIKDVESKAQTFEDEKIVEVYKAYCEKLKSNNALDFNDLILLPIRLLKENAKIFDEPYSREVSRLIIHGCLHLIGLKDKTNIEKENMTNNEDAILREINWAGLFKEQ